MADNELLIKINADAKNATKAFDDVKDKTEDLESKLADVAKISAVAFAAFSAEVFLSVKAFNEAEQATRTLNNALQNQGIFTQELADTYKQYAVEVQNATGLDDDAITSAQATAQAYLGQTQVTRELTQAIADFAEFKKIDLATSAELLAKTIGTETNALARQGLQLSDTATEAEKYGKVIEFVNLKAGGLAATANEGIGGIRGLQTAFGNFQEGIGARFAPIIEVVIQKLTGFFQFLEQSPALTDLVVSVLAAVGVVSALGVAVPLAVSAFTTFTAVMAAFGVASNVALAGIPILIAAIVTGTTFLILNFEKVKETAFSLGSAIKVFFQNIASGIAEIAAGVASFNLEKVKEGLLKVTNAASEANKERLKVNQEYLSAKEAQEKASEAKQDADKREAANAEAALKRQKAAELVRIQNEQNELLRLQNQGASAQAIQLQQQEIAVLQALKQSGNAAEKELLNQKLVELRDLQNEQRVQDQAQAEVFRAQELEARQQLNLEDIELSKQQSAALQADILTENQAELAVLAENLKAKTDARNLELQDRIRYGKTVAVINAALRSEEVQGTKQAAGELVQLQNSKNETLKGIGKAAAVSQIAIATAESAMNIYRGFSTIPIVGPALGIAGAAAAVAFGAERTAGVLAAADGGLVTGGIPGRDSVPALLTPGELVVPARNFDQVVGAVQNNGSAGNDEMLSTLQSIDSKLSQPSQTIIQGDVTADDSYIDALVKKISDAIEFRNAQIFGVNI
jgi:hypothetical protein